MVELQPAMPIVQAFAIVAFLVVVLVMMADRFNAFPRKMCSASIHANPHPNWCVDDVVRDVVCCEFTVKTCQRCVRRYETYCTTSSGVCRLAYRTY